MDRWRIHPCCWVVRDDFIEFFKNGNIDSSNTLAKLEIIAIGL